MSAALEYSKKLWTEAELEALPGEDYIHEVVNGRLRVIHPEEEFVEICHSPTDRRIVGKGALLDGEQLLPGFQFAIAALFKDWDWE